MKPIAGPALVCILLLYPETALNAALSAMRAWYSSVAPALFPFMALMPLLTCAESVRVWEYILGRVMRPLLNLPGSAAPAIVIAMTAGSPAGAHAAVRMGISRGQLERLLWCTCGLSPAFLVAGIGASMLSSPADGRILLRAQLFSQLTMLLLTRNIPDGTPIPQQKSMTAPEPVRTAVMNILTVCGYMTVFSVAAAVISRILQSETAGLAALCLLDAPSGARALSNLPINRGKKLLLLAALTGWGGACIAVQNLAACRNTGVSTVKYLLARVAHAALTTCATAFQLHRNAPNPSISLKPMEISALIAAFFAMLTLFFWKKDPYLNKRKPEKLGGNVSEKHKNPQYIVDK